MKTKHPIAFVGKNSKYRAALLVASLSAFASAHATILIDLPDLILQPNLAGQSFDILVQNDSTPVSVTGINFELQVADAGPGWTGNSSAPAGTIVGPAISNIDVVTGTIFNSNNTGNNGSGAITTQLFEGSTTTSSSHVDLPSSSKAATVIFDTTGVAPGTYNYTLNTYNGPTEYSGLSGEHLSVSMGDGTLTVVPEPSQYAAIFGGLCFGAVLVSRRLKRSAAKV